MQFHFNKKQLIRWFYYIIGMLILALYVLFVMLEFILKGKTGAGPTSCRSRSALSSLVFWTCSQHGLILQIPVSLYGWLFWRLQLS